MASILLSAVLSAGGALLGGATVGSALLLGAISAGLGFLSKILAPKPKLFGFSDNDYRTQIKGNYTEARYIFGEARVNGLFTTYDEVIRRKNNKGTNSFYQTIVCF